MKKLLLILAIALPMMVQAQQKIAHINSQELFVLMPEVKVMNAKLDTLAGQYESQFANMQEEYNKKIVEFQQQMSTMTDGVKEFRQQEIIDMEQRIKLFGETAQKDLAAKQQEYFRPIQEKVMAAIKKVGAEQGCTYVVEATSLLFISDDAIDLLPLVKKELGIK